MSTARIARMPFAERELSTYEFISAAIRNPLEITPRRSCEEPVISTKRLGHRFHMLADPDGLKRVLLDKVDNYPKAQATMRILRAGGEDNLFVTNGEKWRRHRRALAPVFQRRHLDGFIPLFSAAANACMTRIGAQLAGSGRATIEVEQEMISATLEVITEILLSGEGKFDPEETAAQIRRGLEEFGALSVADIFSWPSWIPLFKRQTRSIADIRALTSRIVDYRLEQPEANWPADLLSLMLRAENPDTGQTMSTEEIKSNVLVFLVAGHETTSLSLSWSLYLLAHHPEIQTKAAEQVRESLGEATVSAENSDALAYIRQIIEEGMRLFPPAALTSRQAILPDTVAGCKVHVGDVIILPFQALHRNKMLWDEPERFDPSRFEPDKVKARHRFAYLPFGGGPRICIAQQFALIEATVILAQLLRDYEFLPEPGHIPQPQLHVTLRSRNGLPLKVQRRA